MCSTKKGSIYASFFIFLFFHFTQVSEAQSFSSNPQWQALLHATMAGSKVTDKRFFLSSGKFSLQKEFSASKDKLLGEKTDASLLCRFPARHVWLSQITNTPVSQFEHCAGLNEFLDKVPHSDVSLVFASENLASPSSMMGHLFLKISGNNGSGYKEHAVSFFTELETINIPKLLFESLVTGKKGFFALSPYQEKVDLYIAEEGRNIWEYRLKLDKAQRRLLMLHLWEIKQIQLTYFFDNYNCATILNFILAVTNPDLLPHKVKNTTPIDVVKAVDKNSALASVRLIPSQQWKARMLKSSLNKTQIDKVNRFIQTADESYILNTSHDEDRFLMRELAAVYLDKLHTSRKIASKRYQLLKLRLAELGNSEVKTFNIDLSDYKSPIKTPPDSQWGFGVKSEDSTLYMRLKYLPVAHAIDDDNRQFFSENELKISELDILFNNNKIIVDRFTVYSVQSLIPSDRILGGLSGRLNIGYARNFDSQLEKHGSTVVLGGLGKTINLHKNISLYSLFNFGLGYGKSKGFALVAPEVGFIVKERNNFKTHLNFVYRWNDFNSKQAVPRIKVTQAKYLNNNWALFLGLEAAWRHNKRVNNFSFTVKKYF